MIMFIERPPYITQGRRRAGTQGPPLERPGTCNILRTTYFDRDMAFNRRGAKIEENGKALVRT